MSRYHIVLCQLANETARVVPGTSITGRTAQHVVRALLEKYANRFYGVEGKGWRIVQDEALVGFHVKALGAFVGETLVFKVQQTTK